MRFMALIVTLASWLMISTFAFPQSGQSFLLCWIVALLVSGISIASPGRMNLRLSSPGWRSSSSGRPSCSPTSPSRRG